MIKVVLLGSGNVAYHLARMFQNSNEIEFVQHYRRNNKNDTLFDLDIPKTDSLNNLKKGDIYIIAVSDDAISKLSKKIHVSKGLVVHTSGSVGLNQLLCKTNRGVFYPLQSFSLNKKIDYKKIPICIETEFKEDMALLKKLALSISNNVFEINSLQREKLHIAAVFANNFTNYMYKISKDICDENGISFDVLKPLIYATAQKIETLSPDKAQTGPAIRGDSKIIKKHLKQLSGNQKKIYKIITKSIHKINK